MDDILVNNDIGDNNSLPMCWVHFYLNVPVTMASRHVNNSMWNKQEDKKNKNYLTIQCKRLKEKPGNISNDWSFTSDTIK